jgi:hypothetical protein
MSWTQVGSVVVVAARQFNPSVITQLWLVRNGLLVDDDFLPGCIFTDVIVQVRSRRFHMLIVPEQLQFVPAVPPEEEQGQIVDSLGRLVATLPHTPYTALGLNFAWHLRLGERNVSQVTRELFFQRGIPLFANFDREDAHFGGYLSKDYLGFRLKLDVKPVIVQEEGRNENRVQFAFNFHADLTVADQIEDRLLRWNEVRQEAERIIDAVERRQ